MTCVLAVLCGATVAGNDDTPRGPSRIFPLEVAWSTDLGGGPNHEAAYEPTRAYVALRDGSLVAVDLERGDILWSVAQPTDHPPVIGDGLVIVARDREVVGLRAGDARALWTLDIGSAVSAPPLWTSGWLVLGLASGDVVVIRGFDGHELWRRPLGGTLLMRPAIAGGRLYVPVEEGRIVVFELADGSQVWERALGGSPRDLLPLDALFVGSTDNYLYRLSIDDGAVDWQMRTGGDVIGAPSVDAERVYFLALDNIVRALDRTSGVQQWRQPLTGRPTAGPALVGDLLVVAGLSPEVLMIDAATGRPGGRYEVDGELGAQPYVLPGLPAVGTRMVVITGDGRVVGLARGAGPDRLTLAFPPAPLLPQPALLTLADLIVVDAPPLAWVPPVVIGIRATRARGRSVQLGAFRDSAGAEALAHRLIDAGFEAYVVEPPDDEPTGLHMVRVGDNLGRLAAEQLADRLEREELLETLIVEPQ